MSCWMLVDAHCIVGKCQLGPSVIMGILGLQYERGYVCTKHIQSTYSARRNIVLRTCLYAWYGPAEVIRT